MANRSVAFELVGVDCVTCAIAIEKKLKKMNGVEKVGSAIMLNRVYVDYDDSKVGLESIVKAIRDSGYGNWIASVRDAPLGEKKD